MTPYPIIYCPAGVKPPACTPHRAGFGVSDHAGPDATVLPGETRMGGSGHTYGAPFRPGDWRRTPAGWWLLCEGHRPQDLTRLPAHPAVRTWRFVDGADPGQRWRVPVLLTLDGGDLIDATDRRWTTTGWQTADTLRAVMEPLLAIANGTPLAMTVEERNAAVVRLVPAALPPPGVEHYQGHRSSGTFSISARRSSASGR